MNTKTNQNGVIYTGSPETCSCSENMKDVGSHDPYINLRSKELHGSKISSFPKSYPISLTDKQDELSRISAGRNTENVQNIVFEQEIYIIIDEINQQMCLLKKLVGMMFQHQKEKCNHYQLYSECIGQTDYTSKENTEDDRSRGGETHTKVVGSSVDDPLECNFYRQHLTSGEVYEQKLYTNTIKDFCLQRNGESNRCCGQFSSPQKLKAGRLHKMNSSNTYNHLNNINKIEKIVGDEIDFYKMANGKGTEFPQEEQRFIGGGLAFKQLNNNKDDLIYVSKSFVEGMKKIQEDISDLKNDVTELKQRKFFCLDSYIEDQLKNPTSKNDLNLSAISIHEQSLP